MGLLKWLFRGVIDDARRSTDGMVEQLLTLERDRLQRDGEMEKLRRDIEYKSRELELMHITEISEEKRKDRQQAVALREMRRANAQKARDKLKEMKANGQLTPQGRKIPNGVPGCVVCQDPSSPQLQADEIKWHSAGHPGAMN